MLYTAQTNSPSTTLASAAAAADTTLTLTSGSVFSDLTLPNLLTIGYTQSNSETVIVTAISGNSATVTRGIDGTATDWAADTPVARVFTAYDWNTLLTTFGNRTKLYTASCTTAASTAAKVATLDDDTDFSLTAGVMVAVRFTYGNSATTPTLRVDGSTTGTAKTIAIPSSVTAFTTGNGTTYNSWGARETILFTYTGTYWTHLPSGYLGYLAYALADGKQASIGTTSGILKGDGSGNISAAVSGTDYALPSAIPSAYTSTPEMDGTGSAGSSTSYAKGDHVHPTDTTRQASIGTTSGILKGNGSGGISAATAGTDYVAPSALNNYVPTTDKGAASGIATLDANTKVTPAQASAYIQSYSSTHDIGTSDYGCLLLVTGTTTINIPTGATVGTEVEVMNYGTGTVTIAGKTSSVLVNGTAGGSVNVADQYTSCVLKCVASNTWVAQGAIS